MNSTYDAGGNVLADGQNQYAYDGEGRPSTPRTKTCPREPRKPTQLCAVKSMGGQYTGYLYDAEGLRVAHF